MTDRTFRKAFTDWWSLLQDRFGQEKPKTVAAFYYRTLEPQLSVEELDDAMAQVAYEGTYFPSPKEIVDAAHGSSEAQAANQWELCQRIMQGSPEVLDQMSDAGRKTVALLGGPGRLRMTKLESVPFVRKEFMRLYGHAREIYEREQRTVGPWNDEGRELSDGLVNLALGPGDKADDAA